nr:MAG: replication associated protein [Cressdnaviricota sp.]
MSQTRYRNFCFTHNNYPDTVLEDSIECKFIAYAHEVGDSGTPHLQGYICFSNAKTKKAVIKLMPGCHISVMVGTLTQNETYCSKVDSLITRGVAPISNDNKGRAEKLRYQTAWDLAKSGKIEEIDADIKLRHYSTLRRIEKDYMLKPPDLNNVCGLWIYGETGSGKSHVVITTYPDRYIKPKNKWWDGYQGEDVVHLDELSPEDTKWMANYLKLWADKWPFAAEVKGGAMQLRPKKFIVTSNYSIGDMMFAPNDLGAIRRRFVEVKKVREQNIIV